MITYHIPEQAPSAKLIFMGLRCTCSDSEQVPIDYNAFERKGDADMCTVFEETRKEGVIEGRAEGRAE
jgi:hypothetical protein